MELKHAEHLKEKHSKPYKNVEISEEFSNRIKDKQTNLLRSLVWVVFLVVTGALVANYINNSSPLDIFTIRIIRGISIILITWSVLGRLEDIQTNKGQTLLELTNTYLYKWFYSLGVFLGSISLFLESVKNT